MFCPCYLTWGQTMVEVIKIMMTSFKRSHAGTAILSAPNPAAGHHQPMPPLRFLDLHRQVWVSLLWGHGSFSCGFWCIHCSVCALQKSISPVLCKSGSSMVGLMVTSSRRAYAIPRSTACRVPALHSPLLTHTSSGDTKIQFCLSLCWVSGSWCTQGMFEPSEHLWWVWGLILNAISPLLPFCSEKAMAPHSSTLALKIPWTEETGRLQSMGSRRVGHDWTTSLSLFTFMHWRRKWWPTPVFLP